MTVPHPRSSGPARLRRAREAGGVAGPQTSWAWPFSWPIATVVSQLPTNVGGAVTAYAIESGALPTGLSLDADTGEISGTVAGAISTGSLVVTVDGAGGRSSVYIGWAVTVQLPIVSYAGSPFAWTDAVEIDPAAITNTGGDVETFAIVSGALPDGVELNAATGEITGTPVGEGTGSAVIRATNASGYDDATVEWEVAAA